MKSACLILIITILFGLAACYPVVPSVSPSLTDSTSSPTGTSVSGRWQTLSSGNKVLDLLVTGNEVWTATTGGVVRWNAEDGTYRRYTTLDGLASNTVREVVRDGQGGSIIAWDCAMARSV